MNSITKWLSVAAMLVIGGLVFAQNGYAQESDAQAAPDFDRIQAEIRKKLGIGVFSVSEAPIASPTLYQISTARGLIYVTEDLRYLFVGDLIDADDNFANLTDRAMDGIRKSQLQSVEGTTIDFKAKDEKYVIHVFTDVSCGYCRKLHQEMNEYNKLGITVRYLAFPRGGSRSSAFATMGNVWCAEDQQEAMNEAKAQKDVPSTACADPINMHYKLGGEFAVTGTPALVLESGELISGYMPANRLLSELKKRDGKI